MVKEGKMKHHLNYEGTAACGSNADKKHLHNLNERYGPELTCKKCLTAYYKILDYRKGMK
jgi:hypothetical protein